MADADVPWKQKDWLYEEYIVKERSTNDMAEDFDCQPGSISYWLKKHDISTRSKSEAKADGNTKPLHDPEWLEDQYHGEGKSIPEIANELDVAGSTVRNWLMRHDIERRKSPQEKSEEFESLKDESVLREKYHENGQTLAEIAQDYDVSETTVRDWFLELGIETRLVGQRGSADYGKLEDAEYLRRKYIDEGHTMEEIAEECDVSVSLVFDRLGRHNIKSRSRGSPIDGDSERLNDEQYLKQRYCEDEWATCEIAEELGVSNVAVYSRMDKFGIERRSRSDSIANGDLSKLSDPEYLRTEYYDKKRPVEAIANDLGLSNSPILNAMDRYGMERREQSVAMTDGDIRKVQDEQWLREQYWEQSKSLTVIAEETELNDETVRAYFYRHGIELRDRAEAIPSGEDHPDWKGGHSPTYGPNWPEQREKARLRDQARCRRCGDTESEQRSKYGCRHPIHHIVPRERYIDESGELDYEKANRLSNLITFCSQCHPKMEGLPIDNR